jgi:CRISPR-associated endonuclease/helicase Cas3
VTAIAKTDRETGARRSLIGHSLDVALAASCLLSAGVLKDRLAVACGHALTATHLARLAYLAGLHDCGKALVGFQERITGQGPGTSHLAEALAALMGEPKVQAALGVSELSPWFSDASAALFCAICHHGSPVAQGDISVALARVRAQVAASASYDPVREMESLTAELRQRFPQARGSAPPIQWTTSFDHLFAGVVMLADWLGSSLPVPGPDWRPQDVAALLATLPWSDWHSGAPANLILPGQPLGAQAVIHEVPLSERLVIIEAPTGTGKTEAALLRALQLVAAGRVDGMYFALPTRAAATEIHERIGKLARAHSPALAARVVRAVAGNLATDPIARAVPGLLDLDPWQQSRSWAVASPKRVMAAPIVVGTIDQAMLATLRARHAWMRHAALSRHLLVIDEVHASDPYMLEIVRTLVRRHLDLGGHVLLMSATLGELLRAELEQRPRLPLDRALAAPYPVVNALPVAVPTLSSTLRLADYRVALHAIAACVRVGGCALIIRSTVDTAIETYQELSNKGIAAMLHHSRFADVDRQYLDGQLVGIIGKGGTRAPIAIVATQTAEQSLDIDADLLVSDPAPADVLLQRRGRLGRHRPAQVLPMIVLSAQAEEETAAMALRRVQGKRGKMPTGSTWAYVYDVLGTLATLELLQGKDAITVPTDVRLLVETATHPDGLAAFAERRGWTQLWRETWGKRLAQRQLAQGGLLDWKRPYEGQPVTEAIATRLGEGSVTVELSTPMPSPLTGEAIAALPVPWRWLRDVQNGTPGIAVPHATGGFSIEVGTQRFHYGVLGLGR